MARAARRKGRTSAPRTKARKKAASRSRTPAAGRRTAARRADFAAPIEDHAARLPPLVRALVDELRALIGEAAPGATSALKWGIPWFELDGAMFCAVAGFRAHANLILPGAPGTYADPEGLLEGEGKTGKHLKLRPGEPLPRAAIRGWLRTAVERARAGGGMR
jgi:hypothetical protein